MLFYFIFCFSKPINHQKKVEHDDNSKKSNNIERKNIIYIEKLYDYKPELDLYLKKYEDEKLREELFNRKILYVLQLILLNKKDKNEIDFDKVDTNYNDFRLLIDFSLLPEKFFKKIQNKINEFKSSLNGGSYSKLLSELCIIYQKENKTRLEEVYLYHFLYIEMMILRKNEKLDSCDIYSCIENEYKKLMYCDPSANKIKKNKKVTMEKFDFTNNKQGKNIIIFDTCPFYSFLFFIFRDEKKFSIQDCYEILEKHLFINILHLRCFILEKEIEIRITKKIFDSNDITTYRQSLDLKKGTKIYENLNKLSESLKKFESMDMAKIYEEIKRNNINLELKMNEQVKKILDKYYTENYQKKNKSHVNVTEIEVNPDIKNHGVERETHEKTKGNSNAKNVNNEVKNTSNKHEHIKDESEKNYSANQFNGHIDLTRINENNDSRSSKNEQTYYKQFFNEQSKNFSSKYKNEIDIITEQKEKQRNSDTENQNCIKKQDNTGKIFNRDGLKYNINLQVSLLVIYKDLLFKFIKPDLLNIHGKIRNLDNEIERLESLSSKLDDYSKLFKEHLIFEKFLHDLLCLIGYYQCFFCENIQNSTLFQKYMNIKEYYNIPEELKNEKENGFHICYEYLQKINIANKALSLTENYINNLKYKSLLEMIKYFKSKVAIHPTFIDEKNNDVLKYIYFQMLKIGNELMDHSIKVIYNLINSPKSSIKTLNK